MAEITPDRPLGSLFAELTQETAALFRHEVLLAKTELADKARQAGRGATEIAVGGVVLLVALHVLAATAVLALMTVMQPWLAALIVTVVVAAAGCLVLFRGLGNVRASNLAPRRTMDTLRDNTHWAKEQLR